MKKRWKKKLQRNEQSSNDFRRGHLMTGGRVMANLDNVKMEDIQPLLELDWRKQRDRIKFS
jgi:hypothetical protein